MWQWCNCPSQAAPLARAGVLYGWGGVWEGQWGGGRGGALALGADSGRLVGGGGLGGVIWGVRAPKAKRWSIAGSLYLPLPSL